MFFTTANDIANVFEAIGERLQNTRAHSHLLIPNAFSNCSPRPELIFMLSTNDTNSIEVR